MNGVPKRTKDRILQRIDVLCASRRTEFMDPPANSILSAMTQLQTANATDFHEPSKEHDLTQAYNKPNTLACRGPLFCSL